MLKLKTELLSKWWARDASYLLLWKDNWTAGKGGNKNAPYLHLKHSRSYERALPYTYLVSIPNFQKMPSFTVSVSNCVVSFALWITAFTLPLAKMNYFGVAPSHLMLFLRFIALRCLAFIALAFCCFHIFRSLSSSSSLLLHLASFFSILRASTHFPSLLVLILEIVNKYHLNIQVRYTWNCSSHIMMQYVVTGEVLCRQGWTNKKLSGLKVE